MRAPINSLAERCDRCHRSKDWKLSTLFNFSAEADERPRILRHSLILNIMRCSARGSYSHKLKVWMWALEICRLRIFGRQPRLVISFSADYISTLARQLDHMVNRLAQKFWSVPKCHLIPCRTSLLPTSMLPNIISTRNIDEKLDFDEFPREIQGHILGYLPYEQVFQMKCISSSVRALAESDQFQASPSRKKLSLTACYFFIEKGVWKWAGYDLSTEKWRLLPPLTFLPSSCTPDPDLFKEFLICARDGLVCINFSKSVGEERLIVFNPLSGVWKQLPPLNHRRNPVLMHMLVDPVTKAYQVIAAGSDNCKDVSRVTEVFDSCTGMWKQTGDILGPLFALNEYQSGVYQDGKILCTGFVEENGQVGKGILAYDVAEGKWAAKFTHLLPFSSGATILQLVDCHGEVFLFSERECGRSIEHCVDRLEWAESQLIKVVRKKKTGGRSLEVYPEHVCVPYGVGQLCIRNAIDHTGVVYDIRERGQSEFLLPALPEEGFRGELGFFCLNPMSFTIEPRFSSKVYSRVAQVKVKVKV